MPRSVRFIFYAVFYAVDAAGGAALIARKTGVWLALPVVGRYLRAWGFTAQRPMRRGANMLRMHQIAPPLRSSAISAAESPSQPP